MAEKGVKYSRSELSKVVGSICDNKDFVMKTSQGAVNNVGAKIEWTKRSFLKPEDPPPVSKNNLSKHLETLTRTLDYKQQCFLSPSEDIHYERVGPEAIGTSKKLYDQILDHAIKLHERWPMVRGMVAPVKIRVEEVIEHDDGIFSTELIDGDQYAVFNVLFDTGACGSILDKRT